MKRLIQTVVALVAVGLLASSATAVLSTTGDDGGRMNVFRVTGYNSSNGGEFTVQKDGIPQYLSNAAYDAKTKDQAGNLNSFQTFCIERDEFIAKPVDITVSTTFVDASGNDTGEGSHAVKGGQNTDLGDNLDVRTAFLYTQFAKGSLAGYDYTAGAARSASAAALQNAIWYIEEEVDTLDAGLATTFYDMAVAAKWANIGNVRILNMYDPGFRNDLSKVHQDQLYLLVPAPAAFGLGLFGLGLVGWIKRRMA